MKCDTKEIRMVMETDIDMNGHKLLNHSVVSKTFITAYYKKSQYVNRLFMNGTSPYEIIPFDCILSSISCCFYTVSSRDYLITLKIKSNNGSKTQTLNSTSNERKQEFNIQMSLSKHEIFWIEIYKRYTNKQIPHNEAVFALY